LTAGSDLKGVGGPVLAALAAGPVVWLTFYRVLAPGGQPARRLRPSADSASAAAS